MERLPGELLLAVLGHLSPGLQLQAMRSVSRRFCNVIDSDSRLRYRQLCASAGIVERTVTDYAAALRRLEREQVALQACSFAATDRAPICCFESMPFACEPIRIDDKIYIASTMQRADVLGRGIVIYQRTDSGYELLERRRMKLPFLDWVADASQNLLILSSRVEWVQKLFFAISI